MKRRLLSLSVILAVTLSVLIPLSVLAAEEATRIPVLSSAVSVIAKTEPLIKSAKAGEEIRFQAADFEKALGVSSLSSITVTRLPSSESGVLRLSNMRVSAGQTIKTESLAYLRFTPADPLTKEAIFGFTCDGYAGDAEIECRMVYRTGDNTPPTAGDATSSVVTHAGISLHGQMTGSDAEGDTLSFHIVSYPKRGTLRVEDKESGRFIYTPNAGFAGKDSFSYIVRDQNGAYSETQSVSVTVKKCESALVLSDMSGSSAHNAAHAMCEAGVMDASMYNGVASFRPDDEMTREEFVVTLLRAKGEAALPYTTTSFEDDADVKVENRGAIATAFVKGYVNGRLEESGLFFRPGEKVTAFEAAVMLCRAYDITLPDSVETAAGLEEVPVWATGAVYAMEEMGIPVLSGDGGRALTRAEVAAMLYAFTEK